MSLIYNFSFTDRMRIYSLYPTFGLMLTHSGIYIDYEYHLEQNNSILIDTDSNVKMYRNDIMVDCCIESARLVAYNENNIVIEIFDSEKPKYPYATFLLKDSTKFSKDEIEKATANIDQFYIDNKHVFDEANGRELFVIAFKLPPFGVAFFLYRHSAFLQKTP